MSTDPLRPAARPGLLRQRLIGALLVFWIAAGAVYWLRPDWYLDAEFARQRWMAGLSTEPVAFAGQHWVQATRGPADAPETVVLLHGLAGSKENWFDVVRHLPRDWRILVPDVAGFGGSEPSPDGDYRIPTQVARLHAWVEAQGLGRFHLAGHSMGGHVAGLYAATHPDRVRSLALVNSAGVPFPANDFQKQLEAGRNPFAVTKLADFDRFAALAFEHPPIAPPRVRAAYAARIAPRATLWHEVLRQLIAEDQRYLLQQQLGAIRAPVLVLWCDRDQMLDVGSVAAFEEGLPKATVEILPGCGHMTPMEEPRRTAELLAVLVTRAGP